MLLSVLLLLLLVCGTQAGFLGYVHTYTTKDTQIIGRIRVSFISCGDFDSWLCNGDCSTSNNVYKIDESVGEWCQKAYYWIWAVNSLTSTSWWWFDYTNWVPNMNGITNWRSVINYDLRKRSDINKPNSTPQTNVLPAVRVPSNCQRNISLLTFDPDGDVVKCRYANGIECFTCAPPSVLTLSSSCILSFSPTNSSNEGSYAVQMKMEDFPRQTITLTDNYGAQVVKTTSDYISSIPTEFVFKVVPAVPSCSEGLYLPRFLPPTPENRAQIYAAVNQTLVITIRAEATQSVITGLLFSGPYYMVKSSLGSGIFTLIWTPTDSEVNETHAICFVIQANYSGSVYQSEHRCVLVRVGTTPPPTPPTPPQHHVLYLRMKNYKEILEKAIKDEMIRRGMPPIIGVRFLSDELVEITTAAPPSG